MIEDTHFIDFSRPFVGGVKNVFETMVFTSIEVGEPLLKKDPFSRGEISAVLGLSGEVTKNGKLVNYKAMLVMSFQYETYYKIASAMLGETYTSYAPDIHDLGGEIANIVVGNAKRDLKALGYTSDMAIPSMIEGKNHSINYPAGTQIVLFPIKSQHGTFYMELCYSED